MIIVYWSTLGGIYAQHTGTDGKLGIVTSIHQNTTNAIPPESFISQNFPNPFNPTTQLRFGLRVGGGGVTLMVYDVLGREVAVVAKGYFGAGIHTATWNASHVASGVYFARFTVRDELGGVKFTKVSKLLFMK